jgi:hypothetical protein
MKASEVILITLSASLLVMSMLTFWYIPKYREVKRDSDQLNATLQAVHRELQVQQAIMLGAHSGAAAAAYHGRIADQD